MLLRIALTFFYLIITVIPQSQDNEAPGNYFRFYRTAENFYNAQTPTETTDSIALYNYRRAISILEENKKNDSVLFDSYVKSGIISMSYGRNYQSLTFFLKSILLEKNSNKIPDSLLFKPYLFTGNVYHNMLNMDSALYYYNQAENIITKYPATSEAERIYNQQGALYYETGDYRKSITYFEKALSVIKKQVPLNKYFVVNYENNIASALRKTGDIEQALDIYKNLLVYNINKDELLHNIGACYLQSGNYEAAVSWLEKVKNKDQSLFNDLAATYILSHKNDSALIYLEASLHLQSNLSLGQKNIEYAYTLKYLGDLMLDENRTSEALQKYQQAVIEADPDFKDTAVEQNPQSFYGLHQSFFLFQTLTAKANAFYRKYIDREGVSQLANSFAAYSSALELARHVEQMYNSDESRLFLKKNVDSVYKVTVDVGLRLYEASKDTSYLSKVLKYIEEDKASVLQADLHELELSSIEGLPKNLLNQEKQLKLSISKLNSTLSQNTDSSVNGQLISQIRDKELQLSSVQAKLNDDPAYYKLKFNPPDVDITTIQNELIQKDEAIISYYYSGKRLLCFYITKENFGYTSEVRDANLSTLILKLRNELDAQEQGDPEIVRETSVQLYNYLLRPVAKFLNQAKHLVIIPYNEINYVPFEMLTDSVNNEILLNKFATSYNYSINFLPRYKTDRVKYNVLSFAPFSKKTSEIKNYPILKESGNEVRNLPGKTLLSEYATKQTFMKSASQYHIIHLATHAIVNNEEPLTSFIAFYPYTDSALKNNLYEREIYNLDLEKNQLVILSACETGNGQMINGEGLMSLSRAFFYAGSKSVVTSLWKADDVATAFITRKMHEYLMNGWAKDEALQKAKSDYLKDESIDNRFKTPSFWATLVLTGDFNAIVNKKSYWFTILLGGLISVLILIIVLRKRSK
jgi:CHAT domain-containing protein/Flp pilus assembly protein TadD